MFDPTESQITIDIHKNPPWVQLAEESPGCSQTKLLTYRLVRNKKSLSFYDTELRGSEMRALES